MSQSPIEEFLDAVDRLELDAIMALMADARVLVVDGVGRNPLRRGIRR